MSFLCHLGWFPVSIDMLHICHFLFKHFRHFFLSDTSLSCGSHVLCQLSLLKKRLWSIADSWQCVATPLPIWQSEDIPYGRCLFSLLLGRKQLLCSSEYLHNPQILLCEMTSVKQHLLGHFPRLYKCNHGYPHDGSNHCETARYVEVSELFVS